jgi:hypothetical protein
MRRADTALSSPIQAVENLKDAVDVEFVRAQLGDTQLPYESYVAVFSASAIHWVDPDR